MEHAGDHPMTHATGTDSTVLWVLLLIVFGPSALTLLWVIHLAS